MMLWRGSPPSDLTAQQKAAAKMENHLYRGHVDSQARSLVLDLDFFA